MVSIACKDVLIVSFGDPSEHDPVENTLSCRWPLLHVATKRHALAEVARCQPEVLIVRIGQWWSAESIRLISAIRGHWRPVWLVALARSHSEELETAVRGAGVHCYLMDGALDTVNEAVLALRQPASTQPELTDFETTTAPGRPLRWTPELFSDRYE